MQHGLERNSIATGIYIVIAATHVKLTGHCSKVSRAEARIDRTFALDTYHALGGTRHTIPGDRKFRHPSGRRHPMMTVGC